MINAVFGGTFDPVHSGHIGIAEALLRNGYCDRLIMLLSYVPPHKNGHRITDFRLRLAMLKLAFAGNKQVSVSDLELRLHKNPSYTIEVLAELKKELPPGDGLKIVIGGDSLRDLHLWHDAEKLVDDYDFIVYPRNGATPDFGALEKIWGAEKAEKLLKNIINLPFYEISSTILRKKLENCENTATFIPETVLKFIKEKKLYMKESDL